MLKIGNKVETIKGIGVIIDIRNTHNTAHYNDSVYVVSFNGKIGFPADCDTFSIDEIQVTQ